VTKDTVIIVSATKTQETRISTRLMNSSDHRVEFEMVASDTTMSQFPSWKIEGGQSVDFKTTQLSNGYFPQTLIQVLWSPKEGERKINLSACTNSSCSEREVSLEDGLVLRDTGSGAVINLGGDQ